VTAEAAETHPRRRRSAIKVRRELGKITIKTPEKEKSKRLREAYRVTRGGEQQEKRGRENNKRG
jgi:hypothetical protein